MSAISSFRRTAIRFGRPLMAAALVTLAFAGPAAAQGDLRFRLLEDPESLYNVQLMSSTANGIIGTYLTERLVYFDDKGNPRPWLAESWTISDDQTEVTFKLRSAVKFHDGTNFDAAAVKFHFDRILDPQVASPVRSMVGPLKSIEIPDPLTVKFVFEKPFAPFFGNLAQSSIGFNSPTAVGKFGRQYGRNAVGTGPYVLKSWSPGSEIVLERNPNYRQFREDALNKGAPRAKTVTLTVIPEESVAMAALETRELTSAQITGDTIKRVETNSKLKTLVFQRATNIMFLEFNQNRPPFDDLAFRKALGYAIDRAAIVQAAYSGYGAPALSPLASGIPGFSQEIADKYGTPYDPKKAKAMLAEAGWTPGPDGVLQKGGKPARFVFKTYSGFSTVERALAVIQNNLSDIGIQVSIEGSDWGTFYPSLLKGDWDVALVRWTWHDAGVLTNLFRSPGHRKSLKPSPELDATLDRCNTLVVPDARASCVADAQKLLLENATLVPMVSNFIVLGTQPNVSDYTLDFFTYLIPGDVRVAD